MKFRPLTEHHILFKFPSLVFTCPSESLSPSQNHFTPAQITPSLSCAAKTCYFFRGFLGNHNIKRCATILSFKQGHSLKTIPYGTVSTPCGILMIPCGTLLYHAHLCVHLIRKSFSENGELFANIWTESVSRTCIRFAYMCQFCVHVSFSRTCVNFAYMCQFRVHVSISRTCVRKWYMSLKARSYPCRNQRSYNSILPPIAPHHQVYEPVPWAPFFHSCVITALHIYKSIYIYFCIYK